MKKSINNTDEIKEISIEDLLAELEEASNDDAWQWLLNDEPIPWGPLDDEDGDGEPATGDGDPTPDNVDDNDDE